MRSKADFKAKREGLGMSQSLLAELLGVNRVSVKRWESPSFEWTPPKDAWDLLEEYEKLQGTVVDAAVQQVRKTAREHGVPDAVDLAYWHSEADYERAHPGEGRFWQMANANSRIIARILEDEGYGVVFGFPGVERVEEYLG